MASDPLAGSEVIEATSRVAEEVYLGLRSSRGLTLEPGERDHVDRWIRAGWVTVDSLGKLEVTALGWLRLDALAADLTLVRSRY